MNGRALALRLTATASISLASHSLRMAKPGNHQQVKSGEHGDSFTCAWAFMSTDS